MLDPILEISAVVFAFDNLDIKGIIICRERTAHLYRLDRVHLDFMIQSVS